MYRQEQTKDNSQDASIHIDQGHVSSGLPSLSPAGLVILLPFVPSFQGPQYQDREAAQVHS